MPRIVIRLEGSVVQELMLTRLRTSVGRRPSNDVVLDSQEVSGEHADLQLSGGEVYIEDLGSTNGTYVNGKAVVKEQLLQDGDVLAIGPFVIEYSAEEISSGFEPTMSMQMAKGATRPTPRQQTSQIGVLAKLFGLFSLKRPK